MAIIIIMAGDNGVGTGLGDFGSSIFEGRSCVSILICNASVDGRQFL